MFLLKVEVNSDLELTVRSTRAALKRTFYLVGLFWQRNFLKKHFTTSAPSIYGYRPRTPKTLARKRQLAARGLVESGGHIALVHSGVLRRALTHFTHRQDAYPTRVTIHLIGPSYFKTNYRPGRPNLGQEVTAISADEREQLRRFAQDTVRDEGLVEFKKSKIRKIITA